MLRAPRYVGGDLVRDESDQDEDWEEEEREDGLWEVDDIGRCTLQDDHQPQVRERRGHRRDVIHARRGDPTRIGRRDGDDTDGDDDKQVEGGRADNCRRTEVAAVKASEEQLNELFNPVRDALNATRDWAFSEGFIN